jgi:uncharacterized protein (DUF433 family)
VKSKVISINPDIVHGTPVFAGTRVPISLFFSFISMGGGLDEMDMARGCASDAEAVAA